MATHRALGRGRLTPLRARLLLWISLPLTRALCFAILRFWLSLNEVGRALSLGHGPFFQTFHFKLNSIHTLLVRVKLVHARMVHVFQSGVSGRELSKVSLFCSSE